MFPRPALCLPQTSQLAALPLPLSCLHEAGLDAAEFAAARNGWQRESGRCFCPRCHVLCELGLARRLSAASGQRKQAGFHVTAKKGATWGSDAHLTLSRAAPEKSQRALEILQCAVSGGWVTRWVTRRLPPPVARCAVQGAASPAPYMPSAMRVRQASIGHH
jgi:hypothetical protein